MGLHRQRSGPAAVAPWALPPPAAHPPPGLVSPLRPTLAPLPHPWQIRFVLLLSRQGKVRLAKWYTTISQKDRAKITKEVSGGGYWWVLRWAGCCAGLGAASQHIDVR